MEKEYINIQKDIIPYRFEIQLGTELYEFEIHYNELFDYFTVDLYKNSETLVLGEKVVLNQPLFNDIYDDRYPAPTIIPLDESRQANRVTWDNLNETVFLVVDNRG